jgi:hypothetical protein
MKAARGFEDAIAGVLGDRASGRGVVENQRNGGLREVQMLG